MIDRTSRISSEHLVYAEDEISEWYQDYEYTLERWIELGNLHGGLRCENIVAKPCQTCKHITGSSYTGGVLLNKINQYEVSDGSSDLEVPDSGWDVDSAVAALLQIPEGRRAARQSPDVVDG